MATHSEPDRPFIVVGGGIGGVASALALARRGRQVHVLEQADAFGEIGAGIQLGPNVFKRFDILGIREAISELAVFPNNLVMRDALSGEEITRMPLGDAVIERFGAPYAVIHRADLHRVLLDACHAHENVTLETSREVVDYSDTGDQVTVTMADGGTVAGEAMIGADGIWSMVRERIVGDGKPRVSGHIAYRAVLPLSEVPEHLYSPDVTLWAGPKTHLVHYPLRRGELYNLVVVFHSDRYEEGWDTYGDPEELRERFAGQRPEVLTLLDKIESWRMWVLCDREPVRHWTRGRVTLLGDAAHPMLQYLAQGACMAIEDAVFLADSVAEHPDDLNAAFSAYEDGRYLRTARVQIMARVYGEVYHAANVVRELRNQALGSRTVEQAFESSAWLYGG